LTSHTILQLIEATIQHITIQNQSKMLNLFISWHLYLLLCNYKAHPRKRASRVARAILVLEATMIALPPTNSPFTLALQAIVPLSSSLTILQWKWLKWNNIRVPRKINLIFTYTQVLSILRVSICLNLITCNKLWLINYKIIGSTTLHR